MNSFFSDLEDSIHNAGVLKFSCPNQNCGKSYKYKYDLKRHMKSYCGKEPNYSCFYCQKRFMRKDVWKNHLIIVHKSFVP